MLKIPRIYVDQNIVNYKFFFVGNLSFKFGKILVTSFFKRILMFCSIL